MNNTFERHFLGSLFVIASLLIVELLVQSGWYLSLALPAAVLCYTVYRFSGLRGSLLSALIVSLYPFYHFDWFGWSGIIQVAGGAFLIAAPSGMLKRALREQVLEAEYLRQKAIDTYNGNRSKAVEALDSLDQALKADELVDIKKYVQVARIKLADTLTLIGSWYEIAKNQEVAIEKLEQAKKGKGEQ